MPIQTRESIVVCLPVMSPLVSSLLLFHQPLPYNPDCSCFIL